MRYTAQDLVDLADRLATCNAERGIPTGELYRGIAERKWFEARAALRAAVDSLFEQAKASGAPEYTSMMGSAAQEYFDSVGPQAHPLPAQFRWQECYEAMVGAQAKPVPAVGETWHFLRKGASVVDTREVLEITPNTILFSSTFGGFGSDGERVLRSDVTMVERVEPKA